MTEPTTNPLEGLGGKKFLYAKPELLTAKDHGSLGLTTPERPFEFVRSVRAIPLTMIEFSSAQRHYPIVFSSKTDPVPLAVVGLEGGNNLFVDGAGKWDAECYVPSYLRCYPFAFATEASGKMAVVIDRSADCITENAEFPFFVDGLVSKRTDELMRFCSLYDAERKNTKAMCDRLVELDLLAPLKATYVPKGSTEERTLAEYIGIDTARLNNLTADQVYSLHQAGWLAAIYFQVYSLESWRYLRARSLR